MSRDLRLHRTPFDVLNYEIDREQAAASADGASAEAALAKLRSSMPPMRARARQRQRGRHGVPVMEAGHALWMFVVHPEACGLATAAPSCATMMCRARCSSAWGWYIIALWAKAMKMTKRVHDRAAPSTEVELPQREWKQLPSRAQ